MSDWLRTVYDRADALDAIGFGAYFDDGAPFVMGNSPPMTGPAEIITGLGHFFSAIAGMSHRFTEVWEVDDTLLMQAVVTYTRHDGTTIDLPGLSIIERNGDKIKSQHSYVDAGPIFA